MYYLVFTNCGETVPDLKVTGTVSIRNSYGFLPGDEYYKMPFYGWLALVYALLCCAWLINVYAVSPYGPLRQQHFITMTLAIGLGEALFAYGLFYDWNASGLERRNMFWNVCSIHIASVAKWGVGYILLLTAASGWGITTSDIDDSIVKKLYAVTVLYLPLDYISAAVLGYKHTQRFAPEFMYVAMATQIALATLILAWVFSAIKGVLDTLKERNEEAILQVFQTSWNALIIGVVAAVPPIFFQIIDISQGEHLRGWRYHFLLSEGVNEVFFLIVVMVLMWVWRPQEIMAQFQYSFTEVGQTEAEGDQVAVWKDEDDDEVLPAYDKPSAVRPDTIGVFGSVE